MHENASYLHVPSFQDEVWSTAPWSKSGTLLIRSMLQLARLAINALEIGETHGVSGHCSIPGSSPVSCNLGLETLLKWLGDEALPLKVVQLGSHLLDLTFYNHITDDK